MKHYFEISVWCTYGFQALWVYIKSRSDANRCLQRETFRLLYRWSWCNILVFLPHCLSPHFWGNKPALIGCLSQECNLTQVEQHLIAICIFPPLSSIGRKNLKGGQRKLRLCYVEIYPFCVAAALVISPANENCRLIAKWKKNPKQTQRLDADVWCGLDWIVFLSDTHLFSLQPALLPGLGALTLSAGANWWRRQFIGFCSIVLIWPVCVCVTEPIKLLILAPLLI